MTSTEKVGRRVEEAGHRVEEAGRQVEEAGRQVEEAGRRVEEVGRQVDRLLAELRSGPDPAAGPAAEELARHLVQLYGDGLARIAALLGADRLAELAADPLVATLLLVHDLHPVPAAERIRQALLGSGVQLLVVEEAGVVRLRSAASGCGSARPGLRQEIETVVRRAAPEVTEVYLAMSAPPPPLLQVSLRPGLARRRP